MGTGHTRRSGGPRAVGDVLARYLRTSGLKEKLRSPAVYQCWPEVAGADACRHTRVVGFNNATLYVEVDSAPWLHMLSTFRKRELLEGLRQTMPGVTVKDIRFRIGSGAGSPAEAAERKTCRKHSSPPTTHETSRSYPA